jgi:DNA gyrase/topoisomerase IV subunit A
VFSSHDEPIYEHNVDDGRLIEPTMYCPVIPMVLVNGADGIGTGWSTTIPNYHPVDIVNNLKRRMGRLDGDSEEKPFTTMIPWFRGWKGTPEEAGPNRYSFNGVIKEVGNNEVEITELPIRMWTDDFKAKLEDIIKGEKVPSFIKDYKEYNDHKSVHFVIQMDEKHMKAALTDGLSERFKLNKTVATSNLVAFDTRGQIRKYEKVEDILEEYYVYRMVMYTKRKVCQVYTWKQQSLTSDRHIGWPRSIPNIANSRIKLVSSWKSSKTSLSFRRRRSPFLLLSCESVTMKPSRRSLEPKRLARLMMSSRTKRRWLPTRIQVLEILIIFSE